MSTINAIIALLTAIIAVCAIARMDKATAHPVRFAIVLIGAGLLGEALAAFFTAWEPYFDALLYGGIAAYLLAGRRSEGRISVRMTQAWSLVVSAGTFLYFFLALSLS